MPPLRCQPVQRRVRAWCLWAVASVLGIGGCRPPDAPPAVYPVEGAIERIKRLADGSGEITLTYRDRHGVTQRGTGVVNAETEILIDGALAKLDLLREGERASGFVRVDWVGNERKLVAIQIQVSRTTDGPERVGEP